MKHSIKKQFAMIFIGLMAGTILLIWFVNNTFLENYYIQNKQKNLFEVYSKINNASMKENLTSDDFIVELQKLCSQNNIAILVTDSSKSMEPILSSDKDWGNLYGILMENIVTGNRNQRKVYDSTDKYILQISFEPRTNTEYIEMWGLLENSNKFIMRSPVEGIKDSVAISNRFMAYVGFCAIFLSGIIIWFVSKKFAEPIMDLAEISQRITNLDFDAKYTGKRKQDEIAHLGSNINKMSETLQKTISELKTANNELQTDLQNKIEIDEMRKEFLSNVSHELKTPIALIQGYAEGLKEGINEDDDSKDFYCEVIMDEANKMNTLVKKLITLNQLEFGNEVVSFDRFNIVDLIHNHIQSYNLILKQREINVIMKSTEPIYVWADEFKTEEVFMNYFSNAMNHVAGDNIIEVYLIKQEKTVRVCVFNTGMNIPEESLNQIWTKFYKVDKARTREYGGSGIGLSIVKAIMESFNKPYGVKNYENGVEFWFELDLA